MVKKFFTVIMSETRYRVFLSDVKSILKRSKKQRPAIPRFASEPLTSIDEPSLYFCEEKAEESSTEEMCLEVV